MTGDKSRGSVRINRYEQQVNRADMDTAAVLAEALKVPLAYLFAEDDDQAQLLLAFDKLSASERAELLERAQRLVEAHTLKE